MSENRKLVKFLNHNLVQMLKRLTLVTILIGTRERRCMKIGAKTLRIELRRF